MKLDMAMLSDAATALPDGKLYIHGGGVTRITATVLPWTQPQLAIVARFLLEEGDEDESHMLGLTFTNPQGHNMLPETSIEVAPQEQPAAVEGEERFLQLALNIAALTFTADGVYHVGLSLNGETVRSLPIAVIGVAPTGAPSSAPAGTPNRAARRAKAKRRPA